MRLAVNQLLIEMDGIESNPEGIFVIGTTNAPQNIDPALKRSGRFTNKMYVQPPNKEDRKKLFEYYTCDKPHDVIDYDKLAEITENYSPVDIATVCDEAIAPLIEASCKGELKKLTTHDLALIIETERIRGTSLLEWYSTIERNLAEGRFEIDDRILYETIFNDIQRKTSLACQRERDWIYA
jgi:SpoVK/Ycf46/Vps4 family AAA+-type ATPase